MIPSNRPVLGRDLDAVRQEFGLLTNDIIWVLSMSITRWMQVVRQAPDEPVKDPTLALLVRFLAQHPELAVIPKQPTAPEMLAFMNEIADIEPKRFATYFGAESSAAYRWMRPDARPSSTVTRLMHFLKTALLMQDAAASGVGSRRTITQLECPGPPVGIIARTDAGGERSWNRARDF